MIIIIITITIIVIYIINIIIKGLIIRWIEISTTQYIFWGWDFLKINWKVLNKEKT